MKKMILSISSCLLIALILSAAAALWYAQKIFIPQKLKPLLIETAKKANIKIDLENVYYIFPGEFSVRGLTLYDRDIPSQKTLTANNIRIWFKPLELLLKKHVLINKIDLITLKIFPGPGHTFTSKGHIFIDGELSYKLNDPKSLAYEGIITLKDHDIKNMPFVKNISGLNGKIRIFPEKISIIELKGHSFGCPVEFSGFLENFKDPYLDLTETIDLDLSKIDNFLLAKISNSIKSITLSGKSIAILKMSGKLSQWPIKFNGSASVEDAQANIKNLKNTIQNIKGSVSFDENSITIPRLEALYNDIEYDFKATMTSYNAPSIYAVLNSKDLLLETKLRTIDDYVRFDSIDGTWFNSTINLVGEIQNYQNPELKLSGESKLDLEDIQKILSRLFGENNNVSDFINNLKPKGICAMSLFIDGLINNFINCEVGLKAESENLILNGFNLGALDLSAQLKTKVFSVPKLNLTPYSGTLDMQGNINADSEYKIDMKAKDVDLGKLIKDTGFKDKDIWGIVFLNCALTGKGSDLNNLKGQGWLLISNGRLWQFPLLGGFSDFLKLPNLKNIEIKEASGNFVVADKKITTQNLEFSSPQMNMAARGSLGLYGGLDFNIGLSFTPGFAQENQLAKLAMLLVDETGRFLGELKLTGTLKEPKYSFVTLHLDKIFDNAVVNKIKELFKKQP